MVVNRVADLTFTVGIVITFYTFGSVEFGPVFALTPYLNVIPVFFGPFQFSAGGVITVLLFLGAMGKSAQIGLHT
jgi:NADH-quinone oxidoreductase subunit L